MSIKRTFGVEIECSIPNALTSQFTAGPYRRGIQVNGAPSGWNTQQDVSVMSTSGGVPVEVVSPPLAGEDGIAEVFGMVSYLADEGASVNVSCGLHVHVDVSDLTDEERTRIIVLVVGIEDWLYDLNGRLSDHRKGNRYSVESSRWTTGSRYNGLNTTPYTSWAATGRGKPTFEFRMWAGSIDPERVISAAISALSIVEVVRDEEAYYDLLNRFRNRDRSEHGPVLQDLFARVAADDLAADVVAHVMTSAQEAQDTRAQRVS